MKQSHINTIFYFFRKVSNCHIKKSSNRIINLDPLHSSLKYTLTSCFFPMWMWAFFDDLLLNSFSQNGLGNLT